jgi:hypothetical protein
MMSTYEKGKGEKARTEKPPHTHSQDDAKARQPLSQNKVLAFLCRWTYPSDFFFLLWLSEWFVDGTGRPRMRQEESNKKAVEGMATKGGRRMVGISSSVQVNVYVCGGGERQHHRNSCKGAFLSICPPSPPPSLLPVKGGDAEMKDDIPTSRLGEKGKEEAEIAFCLCRKRSAR